MSSQFESLTGKVDYPFPEYEVSAINPIALGQTWLKEAIDLELNEPRAMVMMTANNNRKMSSRVMAILEFADIGIIFATHKCSRKIKDAEEVPFACGHFYWREIGRQLSVSGKIRELNRARAEAEWDKRPIPLHSMSIASHQSEPLESYEQLLLNAKELSTRAALPCPEHYGVYVLEPEAIQFWAASANRLHRRLHFERQKDGWSITRLQP